MAQNAPPAVDTQDIQFQLHEKFTIFSEKDVKSLVSLLAVSSTKGLVFAGNSNCKELKVFKLRDLVDAKTAGKNVNVRVLNLPGEPKILSCSCDGSMLAIKYVLNNTGFLQILQVESFVAPNLCTLCNVPVSPESNTFALQILWNPVIPNNIALVLTDGSVVMLTLNNGGQYDIVTLSREHQVKCGCWSPKGKQIVFGFAEGKLQQFKPNLQPARVIPCPIGILPGPFDCIAVHWLSTFQFAAIFLQRGQDMCPSLFIVNAPKSGQPSYINYYDICYSAPGPRIHQLSFCHIAQWNILLVVSANGVDVGVLSTRETGETPNWIQYNLLDEARIEMPLTALKDETYPLGFAIDTASSHQVTVGENKLNAMPMIHVLSTHGHLVSYNFLNLSPNAANICSPPSPLNDLSGQFVPLSNTLAEEAIASTEEPIPARPSINTSELMALNKPQSTGLDNITFTLGSNMVTSTPAIKEKPVPIFSSQPVASKTTTGFSFPISTTASAAAAITNKPVTGFGVATVASNTAQLSQEFASITPGVAGTGFIAKPNEAVNSSPATQVAAQSVSMNKNTEANKPLYTVPATFTPPNVSQKQLASRAEQKPVKPMAAANKSNLNTGEIDEIVKQMIVIQIQAFENELKQIRQQSKQLMENIGSPDTIKRYTKQLNDLQEIIEEANDHEFEQDVQSLRHSLNESYTMLAECRARFDSYNNPNVIRLSAVSTTDPINRRQLAKLQAYVASNQNQLSQLKQLIDAQWSQYQDVVRRNTKNQMHVPCLDGIYQRMSKLKDLLARQRTKMSYIKTKLRQKGFNYKPSSDIDVTTAAVGALTKNQSIIESLADSILSMSLSQVVSETHAKLSKEKLDALRNFTKRKQEIAVIKPKRPDRIGLKSEVILETKLQTERKQKELVKKQQHLQQKQNQQQHQQQSQQYQQQHQQIVASKAPKNIQPILSSKPQQQQNYKTQQLLKSQSNLQQQQPILAKPTASKPAVVSSQPPTFITPTSSTAATLSFGDNSSFVKTSMSALKSEDVSTPFTGFGMTMTHAGLDVNKSKSTLHVAAATDTDNKENKNTSTPISFSAKVIGGKDVKTFANVGNKTATTQANVMPPASQAFTASTSGGFSAFATTKSAASTNNQSKDAAEKPEEASKNSSFGLASTAPVVFSGFAATNKSTTSSPFAASLFSSNTTTTTTTPGSTTFTTLSLPTSFSFFASVTESTAKVTSSTASNSTKTTTTATSSSQPVVVVSAKSTETKTSNISTAPTAMTPTTTTPTSYNFSSSSAANFATSDTKSSAAPNITITSSASEAVKPVAATPTSPNAPATVIKDDPADSLFSSLSICKPTTKEVEDSNKTENIFSAFAAAAPSATAAGPFSFASASGVGDGAKSFLSSTTTSATAASSGFSFVSAAAATTMSSAGNIFGKPAEAISVSSSLPTTGTTTVASPVTAAEQTSAASTSPFSFGISTSPNASTAGSLFDALSVSSATAAPVVNTTTIAGNIFSGGSSVFGPATTSTSTTTTSMFPGGAAVATSGPSLFGSTALVATTATTPVSGSIFSATSVAMPQSPGSIFGGVPKPEHSVFVSANNANQPDSAGLFATAAANTKPGGNIFGGGSSTGFGSTAGNTIFGGASNTVSSPFAASSPTNAAGSIFGGTANKTAEGGIIFGSPPQQSATSGGSIFGQNTFGANAAQQSAGSIFGGGSAQSPNSGGFGASGGSIFGGSTSDNRAASGGSIFNTAPAAAKLTFGSSNTSPGFGGFSQPSATPAFSSPSAGGFGAAPSVGFGSPQQQSAFAKPAFGGPATFGSPQPAFGAQPTFGGAPTFGSPKGFGSFATTSPTTGFGASVQGAAAPTGNIFETLGSQDSGLSFGNLANSTQAPPQKPTFGGSSFMNYRS